MKQLYVCVSFCVTDVKCFQNFEPIWMDLKLLNPAGEFLPHLWSFSRAVWPVLWLWSLCCFLVEPVKPRKITATWLQIFRWLSPGNIAFAELGSRFVGDCWPSARIPEGRTRCDDGNSQVWQIGVVDKWAYLWNFMVFGTYGTCGLTWSLIVYCIAANHYQWENESDISTSTYCIEQHGM